MKTETNTVPQGKPQPPIRERLAKADEQNRLALQAILKRKKGPADPVKESAGQ